MHSTSQKIYVTLEFTPNPNTLKYSVSQPLFKKGRNVNLETLEQAQLQSPLGEKLFQIEGVAGVLLGPDFVTVTKSEKGLWEQVHRQCSETLQKSLEEGLPILSEAFLAAQTQARAGDESEIEKKIQQVLEEEIRPAVARDGGDIVLERYEDGVVYVHLQGSCSHCPSATATLKMGVEVRLKEVVPEISEVVAL